MLRPPVALFSSARWQLAFIEVEVVLGFWLLTGVWARAGWVVALFTFALFAGASLFLGALGYPSCGCFGMARINPWYALGVDVLALVALWRWRPRPFPRWESGVSCAPSSLWRVRSAALGAALLVASWAATSVVNTYLSATLPMLRGETVTVAPPVTDLGDARPGETRTFFVRARNHTERPIRIIGGTATCSCAATDNLPALLLAGESKTLRIEVRLVGSPGRAQLPFFFYTDDETQPRVVARFTRNLIETPTE
jgi:hypothetical protein